MTDEQIGKNFDSFKSNWLGRIDDFDKVNKYQCVDLIKRYVYTYWGIPNGAFGNAIDYWYRTASPLLNHFDKVATTDVKKGDIVVLETNRTPIVKGKQPGHIMIATGVQGATTFEGMEQNGSTGSGLGQGNDKIRLRSVAKSRIAGVLRPKRQAAGMKLPPVGSAIQLIPVDERTTFKAGTTTKVGTIKVNAWDFIYTVRGYDPKYKNRIIINSKSAGGNGVSLALYYLNGQIIPGWKRI